MNAKGLHIDFDQVDYPRLRSAVLELAAVLADATPTPIDDHLIEWLKGAGAGDDLVEKLRSEL